MQLNQSLQRQFWSHHYWINLLHLKFQFTCFNFPFWFFREAETVNWSYSGTTTHAQLTSVWKFPFNVPSPWSRPRMHASWARSSVDRAWVNGAGIVVPLICIKVWKVQFAYAWSSPLFTSSCQALTTSWELHGLTVIISACRSRGAGFKSHLRQLFNLLFIPLKSPSVHCEAAVLCANQKDVEEESFREQFKSPSL